MYDDDATNSLQAVTTLTINVGDVAEAPVADFNGVTLSVAEDKSVGFQFGTLTASDVDAGAVLTYVRADWWPRADTTIPPPHAHTHAPSATLW